MMDRRGVSPVVGVMLMLVVTIILAAVVSSFSGGLATDEQKAPQASIAAKFVIDAVNDTNTTNYEPDYATGFSAANGILFEHMGGDAFSLDDIEIQLQSGTTKYTISNADQINTTVRSETDGPNATTCLPSGINKYLVEIGSNDGYIQPGDKFMLYADNCYDSSTAAWEPRGVFFTWKPVGATDGFGAQKYTTIEYKIIHKPSGKAIATGTIEVI